MLRITKVTDYGIEILARMARENTQSSAADLAQASSLPLPIVSKVLKILARGGVLESKRGARGGYILARSADQITVAEIIEIFEGRIGLTDCEVGADGAQRECARAETCSVIGPWKAINNAIAETLNSITLAEMAGTLVTGDNGNCTSGG